MSHLEEVSARVDAAIAESVIAHMNELLIALSDDAELRREFSEGVRESFIKASSSESRLISESV